jgi:hypothetical protein
VVRLRRLLERQRALVGLRVSLRIGVFGLRARDKAGKTAERTPIATSGWSDD